ncbi:hypothetical protein [Megasphaera elsdenii]|uniref:hypothetical protein n=1 Tax=Megasphaera elsdenii TaxID=907 RepID=UPI0022E1F4AE|nr:hypothetical protein [Megasphaera elsdenii]
MTQFKLINYIISGGEKQEKSDAASAASLLWFVWRLPKNSRIQRQTMNDPRQTAFT